MAKRSKSDYLMIRMYPEDKDRLVLLAEGAGCTLTSVVLYALEGVSVEWLKERKKEDWSL